MEAEADSTGEIAIEEVQATDEDPVIAACETCPGRTVFTERGNTDAWIATDLTVSPDELL